MYEIKKRSSQKQNIGTFFSKGKKGSLMQSKTLMFLGLIVIGTMLMYTIIAISINSANETKEEVISKDLAYSLMLISAAPSDLFYRYEGNTEDLQVIVTQGEVTVKSAGGESTKRFNLVPGTKLEETTLSYIKSIPLLYSNHEIKFSEAPNLESSCNLIPFKQMNPSGKIKIKITEDESQNKQEEAIEGILKVIDLLNKQEQESQFQIGNSNPDATISIKFNSVNEIDINNVGERTNEGKIACYLTEILRRDFKNDFDAIKSDREEVKTEQTIMPFSGQLITTSDKDKELSIMIGTYADYLKKSGDDKVLFQTNLGTAIFKAIKAATLK